jgi:hypothetical protein
VHDWSAFLIYPITPEKTMFCKEIIVFDQSDSDLVLYMAGCTLAKVPGNQNWLEEKAVGGLPEYICRIARAIHRGDAAKTISQVIAIAVSRVKVWAGGGGGVTAKTRAKAAKAVAEWESKKKAAKLDNKVKASNSDELFLNLSSFNVDDIRRQYRAQNPSSDSMDSWIREMWSDFLIVSKEDVNGTTFVKVPYTVDDKGTATFGQPAEVKQTYVALSHDDLTTTLTDAQLEKAGLIPCTQKDNMSLVEAVALSQRMTKEFSELVAFSADKPHLSAVVELASRTFPTKSRDKMASKGTALPDGSFPIPDKDALRRAIQSFGRAKPADKAKVKAHIMKRARALNALDMIPDSWKS